MKEKKVSHHKLLSEFTNSQTHLLQKQTSWSSKVCGSSSETRGTITDSHQSNVVVTEPQPYDPSRLVVPPVYPGIGGNDLFPGPGVGMYPSGGDFGGGGGSLVGPGHPLFGGGIGGREPGFPGTQPIPPGARFDPIGPPGAPGFEPNRFVARNPRRPRGAHPDLEHFGGDDLNLRSDSGWILEICEPGIREAAPAIYSEHSSFLQ